MSHHAIQLHRGPGGQAGAPPRSAAEPVPAAFEEMAGESQWFHWHGLKIHYKKLGEGAPVVLIHAVDVGASCIEWRRNMSPLAEAFTAYAVDLPGFGLSDVPQESLRADLYLRFVQGFLQYVAEQHPSQRSARVIASGTGAAYAAFIARQQPALIDRLVLVAPAGLSVCHPNPLGPLAFHALGLPFMSALPATASSRSGILEHLQRDVYGDDVRASMNEADARYWIAHRPGADRIERARLSSMLNVNLRGVVPGVKQPVLLAWGRRAKCPPVEDMETWKDLHSRTLPCLFEQSGLCPHSEESAKFNDAALDFLTRDMHVQAEAA